MQILTWAKLLGFLCIRISKAGKSFALIRNCQSSDVFNACKSYELIMTFDIVIFLADPMQQIVVTHHKQTIHQM